MFTCEARLAWQVSDYCWLVFDRWIYRKDLLDVFICLWIFELVTAVKES